MVLSRTTPRRDVRSAINHHLGSRGILSRRGIGIAHHGSRQDNHSTYHGDGVPSTSIAPSYTKSGCGRLLQRTELRTRNVRMESRVDCMSCQSLLQSCSRHVQRHGSACSSSACRHLNLLPDVGSWGPSSPLLLPTGR